MSSLPETRNVPLGYEDAHREWLAQGGEEFRKRFRASAFQEFYVTQYWKLVRLATLQRDRSVCFRCGQQASQVHHLHYDFIGEDHLHPEILVSICRECHEIVEYGRIAESLVATIRRRIAACREFVGARKGFDDQAQQKAFSRLLEYRGKLSELRRLYETKTPYPQIKQWTSQTQADPWSTPLSRHNKQIQERRDFAEKLKRDDERYQRMAKKTLASWKGSESEKAARIVLLLEQEIEKCRVFGKLVASPLLQ